MDSSIASEMVAQQRTHARYGPLVRAATPVPFEMLNTSLVACFEQQAACHAERLAVQAAEGSLTYAELNTAANRLAHQLLAIGVNRDAPIAIVLERSLDAVISLLAVLKTGGYFLCLEPSLPTQRLSQLLNLAAAPLILTASAHQSQIEPALPDGAAVVWLDQMPTSELAHNPGIEISSAQPARLGFTSGSTGAPKPIIRTHRQRLYSDWQRISAYLFSPQDHHTFIYQFSTGISIGALFGALLTGGALHLYPTPPYDMRRLASWIDAQAITQLYLPTVAFRDLLHALTGSDNLPSVRMVFVTGQTIHRQDAELFQRHFAQGSILVCRFGMSETGGLAHYLVDHSTVLADDPLPAGYALPGRELLIVDEQGQPLGFDQPGEIAVRQLLPDEPLADNLANDTEVDQAAGHGAAPIFRTADLGLLRPDGCLIHLGRKDDMVKVRGNRVALAEAERILLSVAGVAQAAIKPFPTSNGDNRLVGYVTSAPGAQLTVTGIREAMSRLAPAYMVPARFVVLPALPLTTSGKVDRQALPPPGTARPELATPFVPPRTELEQQLADLWAELLELDEVGVDDNFFELGGDSLSALSMTLMAEERLGRSVPPEYFQNPTLADLTSLLNGAPAGEAAAETPSGATGTAVQSKKAPAEGNRLRTRIYAAAILRGPVYRKAMLPYALGVRLQRAWLRQPLVQNRIFREQCDLFRACQREAGLLDPHGDRLTRHLMATTWHIWRTQALQTPRNFSRWVTLKGAELVQAAVNRGNGLIIVFTHQKLSTPLTRRLIHTSGCNETCTVTGRPKQGVEASKEANRASNTYQALAMLRRGGGVFVAGEGRGSANPAIQPFYGRQLPLPRGFAELALHSQSSIVAVFSDISIEGGVTLEFVALPTPASTAEVESLLHQYAEMLVERWPRLLPTTLWDRLKYIQRLPVTTQMP